MKIVIISALHGNYEALRALAEAHDKLSVPGDLVKGKGAGRRGEIRRSFGVCEVDA
jgi:hypothetical protein